MDNGTIFSVSTTIGAATEKVRLLYEEVLSWLGENGLWADPKKSELMVFAKQRCNPNLIGANITGAHYSTCAAISHISTVQLLRYLGIFISNKLNWTRHVTTLTTRAYSTIRGIGLLGNSIYGLNLLNWCKVYNALVISTLTYGMPVWYTGIGQKGLIQWLQVAQNEGICKIMGTFKMTPVKPLHNLICVLPICYMLDKLMHSYSTRL